MLVTGCIFCLQVDGPLTGVRAYEVGGGGGGGGVGGGGGGGGGLVSGSLRNGEISVSALTFLYCLRSFRQSSVR